MVEISVIIPTHNRKEFLKRALRSVRAQKGPVFETLVIDDGSTDGTAAMVEKEFPEARYFYFENQGPAAARNRGIERAEGEWIAFLDSDDEWKPGKLRAQKDFFKEHPDYEICQTEEIWIRNGRRVNPMLKHSKKSGRIFEACLPLCIISPSAAMMHRRVFEEIGSFDESLPACEDYDLWLRITAAKPVGLIETPFVIKYGGHTDQRSHAFPAMDRFRIVSLVKILKSGVLNAEQAQRTRSILLSKAEIYCAGAAKRGKQDEVLKIQTLLQSVHETLQTA